jgi:hypothetical protein
MKKLDSNTVHVDSTHATQRLSWYNCTLWCRQVLLSLCIFRHGIVLGLSLYRYIHIYIFSGTILLLPWSTTKLYGSSTRCSTTVLVDYTERYTGAL